MKWKVTLRQERSAEVEVEADDSDAAADKADKMLHEGEFLQIDWELDNEYADDVEEAE